MVYMLYVTDVDIDLYIHFSQYDIKKYSILNGY